MMIERKDFTETARDDLPIWFCIVFLEHNTIFSSTYTITEFELIAVVDPTAPLAPAIKRRSFGPLFSAIRNKTNRFEAVNFSDHDCS